MIRLDRFTILGTIIFSVGFLAILNSSMVWAETSPEHKISFADYYKYEDVGKVSHVEGFIGANTCKQLGGKYFKGTIDALPVSVVALCEFHNYYFKLLEDEGIICSDDESQWQDPKTGEVVDVGSCFPPVSCNAPGSPGIYSDNSEYADEVNNTIPIITKDGKEFEVNIKSNKSVACSNLTFVQEEKKISINSKGEGHAVNAVTIPIDLLDGEFSVRLNGNNTQFTINKTSNNSIITIELDYPNETNQSIRGQTIDIVGTRAIPEFPYFGLTIFGTAMVFVLAIRYTKRTLH